MHHVDDLPECGKEEGRKGSGCINTVIGFYPFTHLSSLAREHQIRASLPLTFLTESHTFLCVSTHLFSPALPCQGLGSCLPRQD